MELLECFEKVHSCAVAEGLRVWCEDQENFEEAPLNVRIERQTWYIASREERPSGVSHSGEMRSSNVVKISRVSSESSAASEKRRMIADTRAAWGEPRSSFGCVK